MPYLGWDIGIFEAWFSGGLSSGLIWEGFPVESSGRLFRDGYPVEISGGLSGWVIRWDYPVGLSGVVIRWGYPVVVVRLGLSGWAYPVRAVRPSILLEPDRIRVLLQPL